MEGHEKKAGLDWFSLDVTMSTKVQLLEAEYGLKGFAVFVKLLQRIYGECGYYCEWNAEVALLFSKQLNEGCNEVSEIVQAAIRRGLFDKDKFDECGILTSEAIQKNYLNSAKRRTKVFLIKEYLLVHGAENIKNVCRKAISVDGNSKNVCRKQQRRVEKSRGYKTHTSPLQVTCASKSQTLDECKKVVEHWNATCSSLPAVKKLTDTRKKSVAARIKEYGISDVLQVIDRTACSDFLLGKVGDKGWSATFDWVIKQPNFTKIIEGNYTNRNRQQTEQGSDDTKERIRIMAEMDEKDTDFINNLYSGEDK